MRQIADPVRQIVGPKPKRKRPEDSFHEAVAELLTRIIGPPGEASSQGVMWYSIEMRNARTHKDKNGRVVCIEGSSRKRRGVVPGIADLYLHWKGETLVVELKAPGKRLSSPQRLRRLAYEATGVGYWPALSIDNVIAALIAFGIPHRRVS